MVTTIEQCIFCWLLMMSISAVVCFGVYWIEKFEKTKTFKRARAKLGWFLLKHFYPLEYTKLKAEMNRRAKNGQNN